MQTARPATTVHPLCQRMQLDEEALQELRRFLQFSERDEDNLRRLRELLRADADAVIAEFYAQLLKSEKLKQFLKDDRTIKHLQETQKNYLLSLGQGTDRLAYCEDRFRIGIAHERVGLEPRWYLGAYALLFEIIRRRLTVRYADSPRLLSDLLATLNKILNLDSLLAIETYHHAALDRLEKTVRQLRKAQKELERLARIDALTEISNRSHLMEALEKELRRGFRFHHPFTLLFLDIDRFKTINDRFGHAHGDKVLKKMIQSIRSVLRPADIIGRFGGEEFLIGLVETGATEARRIAERIRLQAARTHFLLDESTVFLTVSIGLADLPPEGEGLETLIDRADRALYRAKEDGRDRVCASE